MSSLSCVEVKELASELALGVLDGPHRAAALGHLDSCATCRQLVEQLAQAADSLYALAPGADPPLGFETRVMSRLRPARPRRRLRLVGAVVVAAIVSSGLTVAIVRHRDAANQRLTREYVAALRVLGGRSLQAAELRDPEGHRAGEVFLYDGHPSWWFVALDHPAAAPVALELELTSGRRLQFDPVGTTAEQTAWGMRAAGSLAGVTAALLVGPDGKVAYRAERLSS
jgi:hypothetical protein